MENPIIVPFDLNTVRKIKSGEIEGSVLINNYVEWQHLEILGLITNYGLMCMTDIKKRHVRKAIEEEKKFLAEKIIKAKDSRKINIIKRYLSEYEYLLDEMLKHDFKPFERVLVRRNNQERWKLHLFSRESVGDNKYECLGGVGFSQCIPYEGNEHLLGTNKNG